MASGQNLASKYSSRVDERFTRESQAMLALNNDYEFVGVDTVKVYSIPIVPLRDYAKSGSNRYGTVDDLTRNVQTMTVTQDKSFTFLIDRKDKIQSMMATDAGKAMAREIAEVIIPFYDSYIFAKLADAAKKNGQYDSTLVTAANAYELFLKGMEILGDQNVPDKGRVAFCTYKFANFLKRDPAFMKVGDASQDMVIKGVIGEVDGCKIVKVPSGKMPAGAAFILTHPLAATAPKQLEDYKIHDNPPGYSGWLVEGRVVMDCFTLNEKVNAIYYQGGQPVLKRLAVGTAATSAGKTTVNVTTNLSADTNLLYYKTGTSTEAVTYDEIISTTASGSTANTSYGWTALTNGAEITPSAGATVIQVVEVDATNKKAVAAGQTAVNIGA